MITVDDFAKLEIKIGTIVEAEKVADADRLLKLIFDFGDEKRQIISSIADYFSPEELVGKQLPVIVNLEPKKFRGHLSEGMILAADDGSDGIALLFPHKPVVPGSRVR